MATIRIVSWNVNGIRAAHRKGFLDWFEEDRPDTAFVVDLEGCGPCAPNFAEPFDTLDYSDPLAFAIAFTIGDPAADLDVPHGVFDYTDVLAFMVAFAAGCP